MSYTNSSALVQTRTSHFDRGASWRHSESDKLLDSPTSGLSVVRAGPSRAADQWGGLQARMALDARTRADAFRLRHMCYASKGYIDIRDNGLFSDECDAVPDNTTMVVYDGDQAIGSVRVCTMTAPDQTGRVRQLPVAHVFPSEVSALLTPGMRAVEINRLVSHPDHAHSLGLVFILMRLAGYVIGKHNPDFVTSCVRANHVPFYKRLQFEHVAGPRLYTGLKFMTSFMVAKQERYDVVRRTVPILNLCPEANAKYNAMWTGDRIAVFDDD